MKNEDQKQKDAAQKVSVRLAGHGRNAYCVAECPVCGYSHSVDVLGSMASAEAAARENVKRHIAERHAR